MSNIQNHLALLGLKVRDRVSNLKGIVTCAAVLFFYRLSKHSGVLYVSEKF